jgi:hypothetical protein
LQHNPTTLVWPDERTDRVSGLAEAIERDVLLMSRETARTENNLAVLLAARPWDLVVLDEAHAARRRKQEEGEFNSGTLLLTLLRFLQLRRRARGILLLSATPMQTHPWEPWDLLAVLGEGGRWLSDFSEARDFYTMVAAVRNGQCDLETARKEGVLIVADPQFPRADGDQSGGADLDTIARRLAFSPPSQRQQVAQWLRRGAPLARRMHCNTRDTLRHYYERGLLSDSPPRRRVQDIIFDYTDPAERRLYNAVGQYIARRYDELEREKAGKGFVMTIYRRRASSSPLAIERSLERRRDGLLRVVQRKAYDLDLSCQDVPDAVDQDDLAEGEGTGYVSAALPSDPKVARAELAEVEHVLDLLRALHGRDSKRACFFDVLRHITEDGRLVLVFTEYADTLQYLRDTLMDHYGRTLGCYSGDGGQLWDGGDWKSVTKDVITAALQGEKLRVLLCTDAASEGLNLQAAGAVINYDLPWNPSKVEQRIGRVDRIGQRCPTVLVVNLFLKDSVDDRVYRVLRVRCGLFERFVGAMQPVFARARRMLLGQDPADLETLTIAAEQVKRDPVAGETYLESPEDAGLNDQVPLSRQQIEAALSYLNGNFGFQVESDILTGTHVISGPGFSMATLSCKIETLEHDHQVLPLPPFEPRLRELGDRLLRPGERLPLVIGSHQQRAFRRSLTYWVSDDAIVPVETMADLLRRVETWTGTYPDPA